MSITLTALMKQRYDTAANWTAANPTLLAGEIGIESDTKKWKLGDGSTAWTSLGYIPGLSISAYPLVNADISATAEIAVSKLADGTPRQLLQTDAAGTGVEWASNIDIPGTLDVTGAATFDAAVTTTGLISANGKVSFPLGTAALPSLYPGTDTNTGIYSPGADQLAISTNGTERMRLDSTGRLGLGTSSPDVGLHYRGDTPKFRIESSNTLEAAAGTEEIGRIEWEGFKTSNFTVAASIRARQDGTWSTSAQWNAPSALEFYTQNNTGVEVTAPRMLIDSSGRVGIGTTSPSVPLEVSAASTVQFRLVRPTGVDLRLNSYFGNSDLASLSVVTNHPLAFHTNNTERARIDSSGRLLVGTSSALSVADEINGTARSEYGIQRAGTVYSSSMALLNFANSATNARAVSIVLGRSNGSGTTHTLVEDGDELGAVSFQGSDGTKFVRAANIKAVVDGVAAADDMPGRLVFSTTADGASSPTERMRITSNGSVYIKATSLVTPTNTNAGFTYDASNNSLNLAKSGGSTLLLQRLGSDGSIAAFHRETTSVGSISVTTTATAYNTSSDYRLKENIVPLTGAIDRLQQIPVHRFNFIADPDTVVDGFIAHEAQEIVPECVTGTKDEVDDDGNPVYQGIDQSKLVPLLTAALQEALQKIEDLEGRLTAAGI